jgi:hypothetical protein
MNSAYENSEPSVPIEASTRAALYLSNMEASDTHSSTLIDCARQAQALGLRVVTVVGEDHMSASDMQAGGLGGERLRSLIDRMGNDQFDVIVAHIGQGIVTIGKPAQVGQGGTGLGRDGEASHA